MEEYSVNPLHALILQARAGDGWQAMDEDSGRQIVGELAQQVLKTWRKIDKLSCLYISIISNVRLLTI